MKSIGILYICTGPYYLFWKDFFKSFEAKFLTDYEKKYFVFTDAKHIYAEDNPNVKKYKLDPQPWPLITLLRFATFLSIKNDLKDCDYLMFSNANIVCDDFITESEFLPRIEKGEKIFVTSHPGYYKKDKLSFPYERHSRSLAYVPWNCGENYVIGAMFGGTRNAFLTMAKVLNTRIEEDLKRNVIALWHDESHLNRYIVNRSDVRVLHPMYCYPYGLNVSYGKKLSAVGKQSKFDVNKFKGQYDNKPITIKRIIKKINEITKLASIVMLAFDTITFKRVKIIDYEEEK